MPMAMAMLMVMVNDDDDDLVCGDVGDDDGHGDGVW